ncbi:discoidin domain-containing protein [Isoptericola sp. NPDC057653]|uniref:discoidin domain-containing protein n=1 Tax=Isoptericola sp. NPDC057653 TaxID=3346195 RepID=UPI0036B9B516
MELRRRTRSAARGAAATTAALTLVAGVSLTATLTAAAGPAAGSAPRAVVAAAAPAVDVDRYPLGTGADLGEKVTSYGITAASAPVPGAQETGAEGGRGFWRTAPAAGAEKLTLDVADEFVDRLADRPGYLVVDHLAAVAPAATADREDGSPVELAGATEPDTDEDGWTTTVVPLPAGTLHPGGAAEVTLAPAGDGALTVAAVRVVVRTAGVDLGPTVAEDGISVRAGDSPDGLVTGTADGRGYWQTDRAAGTSFVYANVADSLLADTTDRVLVDVAYQDAGGSLFLEYDSPGDEIEDKFKDSTPVELGTSGAWTHHAWLLDDAVLTNRSNGSDFRVSAERSSREVRMDGIAVTAVPRELDPTVALRRLVDRADVAHFAAREGERDGQYPAGSKAALQRAIDAARAVVDDADATGDAVDAATDALVGALESFLAGERTTDLARGAAASAGTTSGGSPAALTDGDDGTAWTSEQGDDAAWAQVDLGRVREIGEITLGWTADYANDYRVEVSSDGDGFTEVARAGALGGGPLRTRFAPTDARFVRVWLDRLATQRAAFGLTAFEVRESPDVELSSTVVPTRFPTEDVVVADVVATDFAVDPRGKADSTHGIQEALDTCQDAGGGTVWLPAGRYRVTDTIEVGAYCTLRGDRRDPDDAGAGARGEYGTVVVADLPSGDDGPSLFLVGGSAGVVGVTTWYPGQDAADPVPYGYTFEIPGLAWQGNQNYMMSTVEHVTMLNSYRGIGISTRRNDRGEGPGAQGHELANVRDVSGTVLFEGAAGYNGADVGVWEDVRFDNAYWAEAGKTFDAPRRSVLDAWTREHGTGFVLADLEWDQFVDLHAADYAVGIKMVKGPRATFTGAFVGVDVRRAGIAVLVEESDDRWGLGVASSRLEGTQAAVRNLSRGYVKLTDVATAGGVEGTVHELDGPGDVPAVPAEVAAPKPPARLFDVTAAPYDVPRTPGRFTGVDATAAIQRALDDAGLAGGGVVYLPAGWYTVAGHLTVPARVELRGASSVPQRDSLVESAGTVLAATAGRDAADAADAPALVTLAGERSGVRGLRVLHPENNPASADGAVPYPFAARGDAPRVYVVNVGMENAWNAVDMTADADRFLVRRVVGLFLENGVRVGANTGGTVQGVLSNGNVATRMAYGIPGWVEAANLFPQVIDGVSREREVLVRATGARRLTVRNTFAYGSRDGVVARGGATVTAFNLGTDNLGPGGHTADADASSRVRVVNLMRYNGTTSRGPVEITNPMAITMAQVTLAVSAAPSTGGSVRVAGNETEPGRYEKGSPVRLRAEPARAHRFVGWRDESGQVVSDEATLDLVLDTDRSLTAEFTPGRRTS